MDNLTREQRARADQAARRANDPNYQPDPEVAKLLGGELIANYKVQVMFGPDRSGLRDFNSLIQFYGSGKHFHGGGDELLYVCMDRLEVATKNMRGEMWRFYLDILNKKVRDHGCGALIPSNAIGGGMAYCENCKMGIVAENLVSEIYLRGTTGDVAKFVAEVWQRVTKGDADVYCKYNREDIRYKVQEQKLGSEEANRLKGKFGYRLSRILKDTSAGATLESRFRAFFNS